MKRTNTMLITTVILSIALTSVFAFEIDTDNAISAIGSDNSIPFVAEAMSNNQHNITMEAVAMPDGLYMLIEW